MIADGPDANRPPHIRAPLSAALSARSLEGFCRVMISKFVRSGCLAATFAAVLMLLAATDARAAEPPKFAGLAGEFSPIDPPLQTPTAAFEDRMGQPVTLHSFKGKVVLLNLWATWCPPCVAEMPSLDALQSELGGEGLAVVAVSTDQQGIKKSAPFYRRAGIAHLQLYNDTRNALAHALEGNALPMSFLLDRQGRVVGRMDGPAQWDSPAAKALIEHYLQGGAS
jgi:thiol-disulfide isomerase/thioredoxin